MSSKIIKFELFYEINILNFIRKSEELFGKVSWSDKSVQYYLHVVDHSKLAHYYEKLNQLNTKGTRSM